MVVGYTRWVGQSLSAIGLHRRKQGSALAIGAGLTVAAFLIATGVQMQNLAPGQSLTLQGVDPKTGMTGGAAFAVFLIVGNVINTQHSQPWVAAHLNQIGCNPLETFCCS